MLRLILLIVAGIVVALAAFAIASIGPRNVIGMLRYDRRRDGDLKVGDPAPDVRLVALDGAAGASLTAAGHGRPLVIVFGSFT